MRVGLEVLGRAAQGFARRAFDSAQAQEFATLLALALTKLGVDPSQYAQRSAVLQYVWRVLKRPRQMMAVAANMLQPIGGVSHTRIIHPLQAMRTDPTVLTHVAT